MPEMKTLNGYEIVDAVARENKVDKRTFSFSNSTRYLVYGIDNKGNETGILAYAGSVGTNAIARFDGGGRLVSNPPQSDANVATKGYVDDLIANTSGGTKFYKHTFTFYDESNGVDSYFVVITNDSTPLSYTYIADYGEPNIETGESFIEGANFGCIELNEDYISGKNNIIKAYYTITDDIYVLTQGQIWDSDEILKEGYVVTNKSYLYDYNYGFTVGIISIGGKDLTACLGTTSKYAIVTDL